MLQNTIDNIAHNNGLYNVNPKLKVIFAISLLLICVLSNSIIVPLIIAIIMIYLTIFKAKVPLKIYLPLIGTPIGFGIITIILMAIIYSGVGDKLFSIGIFGYNISFYEYGVNMGLLVFSRMLGGVACTLFLVLTTPMTKLFYVLKELRVPSSILDIAMMMYRYIFVLLDEAIRIENAQKTRLGYKDLKTTYKSLGILAANLFITSWDRGERLFIILNSRGYNGNLKLLSKIESPNIKYILLILAFDIFLIIIIYLTKDFKVF